MGPITRLRDPLHNMPGNDTGRKGKTKREESARGAKPGNLWGTWLVAQFQSLHMRYSNSGPNKGGWALQRARPNEAVQPGPSVQVGSDTSVAGGVLWREGPYGGGANPGSSTCSENLP